MPWSVVQTIEEAHQFTGRVQFPAGGTIPEREEVLEYEDPDTEEEDQSQTQPFIDLSEEPLPNSKPPTLMDQS